MFSKIAKMEEMPESSNMSSVRKSGGKSKRKMSRTTTQHNLVSEESHDIPTRYHTPSSELSVVDLPPIPGPSGLAANTSSILPESFFMFTSIDTDSEASSMEINADLFEESLSFRFSKDDSPETDTIVEFGKDDQKNTASQYQRDESLDSENQEFAIIEAGQEQDKPKPGGKRLVASEPNVARLEDTHFWDINLGASTSSEKKQKFNFNLVSSQTKGKMRQLVRRFSTDGRKTTSTTMSTIKSMTAPNLFKKGKRFQEPTCSTVEEIEGIEQGMEEINQPMQGKKDLDELLKSKKDLKDLIRNKNKLQELTGQLEKSYDFIQNSMSSLRNSVFEQQNMMSQMLKEIQIITLKIAEFEKECVGSDGDGEGKGTRKACVIQ